MVNIVGRQKQYNLDYILRPFECMTSLGERVAGSLWPLCLLLFMQSGNKSTTVPIMIIAWFCGTEQRQTREVSLSDLHMHDTADKRMGTRNSPSTPKAALTWKSHLLHNRRCVLCTTFFIIHTSNIYSKKAPGKESLCSISVCYIWSICSKRILVILLRVALG